MNETIQQLYDRKSVRVFTDQIIEENIVQEILKAAVMAPTAGNQQLYTILRIKDTELLNKLADSVIISRSLQRENWSCYSARIA